MLEVSNKNPTEQQNQASFTDSEIQLLIEQQKNLNELLSKAANRVSPKDASVASLAPTESTTVNPRKINVFNSNDLIKFLDMQKNKKAGKIESTTKSEMTQPLSNREKSPMEKIFSSFETTKFKVKGLVIINNHNNNNNVDEDKFSIDEIIKLLEKKDYIGYKDVMDYDQTRRLKALRAKEESVKKLSKLISSFRKILIIYKTVSKKNFKRQK
jgi:hypothetical protein